MKRHLLSVLLLGVFASPLAADGPTPPDRPVKPQVIVAKPAPDAAPAIEEAPPLTEKVAKNAAMLSLAFNSLPDAVYDKKEAKVIWTLAGQFKQAGVRYDRYSVFLQLEGRTYAGVDLSRQEGDVITLQAFELETCEGPVSNVKVKVVEKDTPDRNFFIFDYTEMDAAAKKAVKDLLKPAN
jgi:hypothetical protein